MIELLKKSYLKYFLVLVVLPLLIFLGIDLLFSFSNQDDGFILGFAWRILQGEIPHKDFIYVRPGFSPLWAAAFLKITSPGIVPLGRVLFHLESLASVLGFYGSYRIHFEKPVRSWHLFMVGIAYLLVIHNFPPMFWHTVDGVLFMSLGFFFLALPKKMPRHSTALWILAGVLLGSAALTKQSFWPALVVLGLGSLYLFRIRSAWILLGMLIPFVGYFLWLRPEGIPPFVNQVLGSSGKGEFFESAIACYLQYKYLPYLVVSGLIIFFQPMAFIGLLCVLLVVAVFKNDLPFLYRNLFLIAAFLPCWALYQKEITKTQWVVLMQGLSVGWAAGISWGWLTPALGFAGTLPIFLNSFENRKNLTEKALFEAALAVFLSVSVVSFVYLRLVKPYNEVPAWEQTFQLSQVGPFFGVLHTSPQNGEAIQKEIDFLRENPSESMILPSSSLYWTLLGKNNPLPLDWPLDAEFKKDHERVGQALRKIKRAYVRNGVCKDPYYGFVCNILSEEFVRVESKSPYHEFYVRK